MRTKESKGRPTDRCRRMASSVLEKKMLVNTAPQFSATQVVKRSFALVIDNVEFVFNQNKFKVFSRPVFVDPEN